MFFKRTHLFFILSALSISTIGALGCSADATADGDADAEEVEESSADLTQAGKALIGSYTDDSGAFRGLILTSNRVGQANEFIADVSTGIVCITTPCPSSEKIKGTFTAGTKTITFKSSTASAHVQHLLGKYNYLVQGAKFSIFRKNFSQSLEKVHSYCSEASDCNSQNIIHPMCVGGFTCTTQNTCGWHCGVPVNTIWPADAKKVVAKNHGGGFMPQPPAGSTCSGQSTYTLDITTKKLSYSTCKIIDWNTPFTTVTGSKTLTAAEMAKVSNSMNDLVLAQDEICGADKPLLTVTVSSPSQGEKKFTDSFYSCWGNGQFVDNIGGVFSTFRDIAGQ